MTWSFCLPEILLLIFDEVHFDTLFVCTQVSSHWRKIARKHPTFWKTLRLSDASLTAGGVAMFLERLHAIHAVNATIRLVLRFSVIGDRLVDTILPAIRRNMHRIEDLSLVLTPVSATCFSDTFAASAPKLRRLHIYIKYLGPATWTNLDDFSDMFQLHKNEVLRSLTLVDVPLPNGLPAVQHAVKDVAVYYIHLHPQLHHVTSWIPFIHSLDVWSAHPVSSKPRKLATAPVLWDHPFRSDALNQISLYCADWYAVLQSLGAFDNLSCVVVRIRRPNPDEAASIVPGNGPLCARIGTRATHPRWSADTGPWGIFAIATQDHTRVRVFEQLSMSHMLSTAFLDRMLSERRLSTLVVSLSDGFIKLCMDGRCFPRLETLCICLNNLPEDCDRWTYGRVVCPRLSTLAFERERETGTCIVTRRAIDAFIEQALEVPGAAALQILLRNMRMTGPKGRARGSRISRITRTVVGPWMAEPGETPQG